MAGHIRWEWLDRYFSGDCTAEQAREIERWIGAAPERREQVEALREIWARGTGASDTRWNARAAWQRLAPTLEMPALDPARGRRLSVIPGARGGNVSAARRRRAFAFRIAAVLTLAVGGAAVWRLGGPDRLTLLDPIIGMREYRAPRGQRASLTLADGTRIVLAPGSTLRTSRGFVRARRRDVYLEGEGAFDVVHDVNRPFLVHAAYGVAEDLGTRFVVTQYPGDTAMRIVVAEGVVAVHGANSTGGTPEVLRASDLATIAPAGRVVTVRDVAVGDYFSWTTGQLVFRNAPVRDVFAVLERWYDIDIQIADSAAEATRRRVTLTTEPGQPLVEVITALVTPAGLRAQWVGGKLVVTP